MVQFSRYLFKNLKHVLTEGNASKARIVVDMCEGYIRITAQFVGGSMNS